ncbi:amidohydrolase family protein [Nonomuraea sp. K274]|uniref:Amidohydrolase family protein n=1 Tax=Nonomuraea cypriaca TaxID=1187855 RepID=A0A931AKT3_9ACTN|nr:amidohydrolase family protein [Nonomuraea cypriaca]MBF8190847.1 amidohydrolase family protein [Nonomuraea cypriaca]
MLPADLPGTVRDALLAPLVDHHCHGVRRDDLSRAEFELLINEGGSPAPPGTTHFDTPFGAALRRWCAPLLDLEPHAPPAVYLARRAELGAGEVNRRLLAGAGVVAFLVDTEPDAAELLSAAEMGRHGGAAADELVRVEQIERDVAEVAQLAVDYLDDLGDELAARATRAVGLKTVIGALCGLDFDPSRPSRGAVIAAANRRLSDPKERLTDPILLRHLLWNAIDVARERGLPMQFHTGFGAAVPGPAASGPDPHRLGGFGADPQRLGGFGADSHRTGAHRLGGSGADPHRADPARMGAFVRALQPLGVPVILLHCYPFHRQAAYLANIYPHVYVDVGLALPQTAAASARVMDELLELAPFHKLLFSSACHGVAETGYLGAHYYRQALGAALAARLRAGEWSAADAARVAHMIGSGNARRVYRL